jgi:hypothetical protein
MEPVREPLDVAVSDADCEPRGVNLSDADSGFDSLKFCMCVPDKSINDFDDDGDADAVPVTVR